MPWASSQQPVTLETLQSSTKDVCGYCRDDSDGGVSLRVEVIDEFALDVIDGTGFYVSNIAENVADAAASAISIEQIRDGAMGDFGG